MGTGEEKAILLYNYLSGLNFDVYLVLGMAVPEGETAFVLYRDKSTNNQWMVNPSTGIKTDVKDSNCSMQQVWALVNQSDVINIPKLYYKKKTNLICNS